jgi:chlorite dismutase
MDSGEFHIKLFSNACMEKFPNNKRAEFTIELDEELYLNREYHWSVALSEIYYTDFDDKHTNGASHDNFRFFSFDYEEMAEKDGLEFTLPQFIKIFLSEISPKIKYDAKSFAAFSDDRNFLGSLDGFNASSINAFIPKDYHWSSNVNNKVKIYFDWGLPSLDSSRLRGLPPVTNQILSDFLAKPYFELYRDRAYSLQLVLAAAVKSIIEKLDLRVNSDFLKTKSSVAVLKSSKIRASSGSDENVDMADDAIANDVEELSNFPRANPKAKLNSILTLRTIEDADADLMTNRLTEFHEKNYKYMRAINKLIHSFMAQFIAQVELITKSLHNKLKSHVSSSEIANKHFDFLFVYSNLCQPIHINETKAKLLRVIPIDKNRNFYIFPTPEFVPLGIYNIKQISISLRNEFGEKFPFQSSLSPVYISLTFRRHL